MYDKLTDLFLDWNSKINLSAIRDREWVKLKHIQDSLEGLKVIEKLTFMSSWTWFRISGWKLEDFGSSPEWQTKRGDKSIWRKMGLYDLNTRLAYKRYKLFCWNL